MSENSGPQFNPQSAYPVGQEPPGHQPSPTYGQPPYGQSPYGQLHPPFTPYAAPDHPSATTALVLGLVSLVGGLMCGVPLLVAPFAWVTGARARREIRASNGQLGGEGTAQAGMVLGIVGTVLLALALIGLVVLIVLLVADARAISDYGTV